MSFRSLPIRAHPRVLRALVLLFTLAFAAHAGSLRTREGKFLEGTVQLDPPGGVKITLATGEQQKFPLASVEQAVFTSGAASSLPPEVAALMKGRGNGLLGTYYERVDFSSSAVHRLDETVNFDWELGEPIAGVQKDYFSARWAGQLEAPVSGKFTFHVDADDGAKLWIADKLVCDAWRVADGVEVSGDIDLKQGERYDLRLEYYDNLGPARLRLSWTGPGIPKSIVPRNQLHAALDERAVELVPLDLERGDDRHEVVDVAGAGDERRQGRAAVPAQRAPGRGEPPEQPPRRVECRPQGAEPAAEDATQEDRHRDHRQRVHDLPPERDLVALRLLPVFAQMLRVRI